MSAPTESQVPKSCRGALRIGTAFTCPDDRVVYLTGPYLARLEAYPPQSMTSLRFAATLAHEMGHVVQLAVRQPQLRGTTAAANRFVEQQADCLSGVWAASVGIDAARFRDAVGQVLLIVDRPAERLTHGTPQQRLAAVERGQRGRTGRACGLIGG